MKKHQPHEKNHSKEKKKNIQSDKWNGKFIWMNVLLVAITLLVYLGSLKNDFVNLDDNKYVMENLSIQKIDLTYCFSSFVMGNYHPLVMLTYSIIYAVKELNPSAYHFVSLLFHLLNTLLVFNLIRQLVKEWEVAYFVALLFGIHPLRVESVAWVSELKDLMYSFFYLLALIYYLKYRNNESNRKPFLFCFLFFLLSLLSKGMAVTLPVVLLLIDYFQQRKFEWKVWLEKIPFFVLSVVFGWIAIKAQQSAEAINDNFPYSIVERILFASYGMVNYLFQFFIPINQSAFYMYPIKPAEEIPAWLFIYPAIVVVIFTIVILSFKRNQTLFFGFAFFLATIMLVLQLLPVGSAVRADRYTYIPSIGIFLLVGIAFFKLYRNPIYKTVTLTVFVIAVCAYSYITTQRVAVWQNSLTLWNDVIEKQPEFAGAYNNRGREFRSKKEIDKAIQDFKTALSLRPKYEDAYFNLGSAYYFKGMQDGMNQAYFLQAKNYLDTCIQLEPGNGFAFLNRGSAYDGLGKPDSALADYDKAIFYKSNIPMALCNRGVSLYKLGRKEEACKSLNEALQLGFKPAQQTIAQLCQ